MPAPGRCSATTTQRETGRTRAGGGRARGQTRRTGNRPLRGWRRDLGNQLDHDAGSPGWRILHVPREWRRAWLAPDCHRGANRRPSPRNLSAEVFAPGKPRRSTRRFVSRSVPTAPRHCGSRRIIPADQAATTSGCRNTTPADGASHTRDLQFAAPVISIPRFLPTGTSCISVLTGPAASAAMISSACRRRRRLRRARGVGRGMNSAGNELASMLSGDNQLLFSSNRPGGVGRIDLYVAQQQARRFPAATPLPGAINTTADEFDAGYLYNDKALLFSRAANPESATVSSTLRLAKAGPTMPAGAFGVVECPGHQQLRTDARLVAARSISFTHQQLYLARFRMKSP